MGDLANISSGGQSQLDLLVEAFQGKQSNHR